jgi:hypothetical protein
MTYEKCGQLQVSPLVLAAFAQNYNEQEHANARKEERHPATISVISRGIIRCHDGTRGSVRSLAIYEGDFLVFFDRDVMAAVQAFKPSDDVLEQVRHQQQGSTHFGDVSKA